MKGLLLNPLFAQGFWLPVKGSSMTAVLDCIFQSTLWVALFLFVFVVGMMLLFVLRYRRKPGSEPEESPDHNTMLEITWTTILIVLVGVMFFTGLRGYLGMNTAPRGAYEIRVDGRKWFWAFTYPNGHVDPVLHVPYGVPVRLLLHTDDVMHSFHVPAMRVKEDLLPGRDTETWFRAIEPGVYPVFCAEYCGTGYSDMTTAVVVHEPGGFVEWMNGVANPYAGMPPVEAGRKIYTDRGCVACHSLDGSKLVGPSFKGIFGRTEKLNDGSEIVVDANYVRESVQDPRAKVVDGFEPTMPPYKGIITEAELDYVIEFIKSLAE